MEFEFSNLNIFLLPNDIIVENAIIGEDCSFNAFVIETTKFTLEALEENENKL